MASTPSTLGRPRGFDADTVLDAATERFLERGYHATSLSDLTAATGLHRGSLYGAFGNKHQLFLTALERHTGQKLALLDADLDGTGSPVAGIRRHLERQAAEATSGRGCLIANVTLELLPADAEVGRVVAAHQRAVLERVAGALDRAQLAGELPADRSTTALARYLYAVCEGMWELGRTTPEPELMREIVEAALRGLR